MSIEHTAYPRAGLLGNPSDGYGGKTIAFTFREFSAWARIQDSDCFLFKSPASEKSIEFSSIDEIRAHANESGFEGPVGLLLASILRFRDFCRERDLPFKERPFAMEFQTTIPRRVGLAGSSAIVTAAVKCLCDFYGVQIPKPLLPQLILEVETKEMGLPAGLQDRVAQVYQGLTYMDFDPEIMARDGHGRYETMDVEIPGLYLAWDDSLEEGTEVAHRDVRRRFDAGDSEVRSVMREIAVLAEEGRDHLIAGDASSLGALLNQNFDLRARIFPIHPGHLRIIETAWKCGVSAKYAGSGGAIVGLVLDIHSYNCLTENLFAIGCKILRPHII